MNEQFEQTGEVIPRISSDRINIVVPMAGLGSRFVEAGYRDPKPFIKIQALPMIDWVLANITAGFCTDKINLYLIINPSHFNLLSATGILDVPCVSVIVSTPHRKGAAVDVLRAKAFINNDTPLMIANSDQWMRFNPLDWYYDMINKDVDGSILVFPDDDPKWSYAECDSLGNVKRVAEKEVISKWATCGAYLYRHGLYFVDAATKMINMNEKVNGEFYVCPAFNKMIKCSNQKVVAYSVSEMWGMGTPVDFENTVKNKLGKIEIPYGFSRRIG